MSLVSMTSKSNRGYSPPCYYTVEGERIVADAIVCDNCEKVIVKGFLGDCHAGAFHEGLVVRAENGETFDACSTQCAMELLLRNMKENDTIEHSRAVILSRLWGKFTKFHKSKISRDS